MGCNDYPAPPKYKKQELGSDPKAYIRLVGQSVASIHINDKEWALHLCEEFGGILLEVPVIANFVVGKW